VPETARARSEHCHCSAARPPPSRQHRVWCVCSVSWKSIEPAGQWHNTSQVCAEQRNRRLCTSMLSPAVDVPLARDSPTWLDSRWSAGITYNLEKTFRGTPAATSCWTSYSGKSALLASVEVTRHGPYWTSSALGGFWGAGVDTKINGSRRWRVLALLSAIHLIHRPPLIGVTPR
jgi:hypothetical protein